MKLKYIFLIVFLLPATVRLLSQEYGRSIQNINLGWKFHAGDLPDGANLALDDSLWQNVDLPHDFQIGQPWVEPDPTETGSLNPAANTRTRLSARGYKEMGTGWYRKTFVPHLSWKDRKVLLDFEGIMLVGDVWLNGMKIGETNYGYLGFEIDITKYLRFDTENVIAVRADTQSPKNSRWYTGGGLFRDVNFIITNADASFARHGIYITTPKITARQATVAIQTEIENNSGRDLDTEICVRVFDPEGHLIVEQTHPLLLGKGYRVREYPLPQLTIEMPKLWSCETPNLYVAEITIRNRITNEEIIDRLTETFGIRSIAYSPHSGFELNGKKVLLKGIANHHELGALGAAAYERAIEKRFQLLKAFGVNHIRCSHNPYSKSFLKLADTYGILIVDELFDKWSQQYAGYRIPWMQLWPQAIPEFIKRSRNHPSVIMWSLGNELQMWWENEYYDWGVTPYKLQDVLVKRYDKTRPTTVAMFPRRRNGNADLPPELALETEITSYNYRYKDFKEDSRMYPNKIFYQSEASVNGMGPNYYGMELDKVIGLAYWGAIDYLGESGGWPRKGWDRGVFQMSLEPKPQAWLMKSLFDDTPVVHMSVMNKADNNPEVWNEVKVGILPLTDHWNYEQGSIVDLYIYTNADEVELIINNKSVGVRENEKDNPEKRNIIHWSDIGYQQGNITAIARINGKEVARHKLETTGKPVALQLEADNCNWQADGLDLQHIRVFAVDSKGRRVHQAEHAVSFQLQGDARIVAVDNGDIRSEELHVGHERRLYQGSALVILRAGCNPGSVMLTASTQGLKPAKLKLSTH
ncbi:glycoside hydrolase family 2 TIM barrel-domain containing protein [Bacteroides sp. 51]|uniref:glycoside hydrolase family 2 TIM barrel-domain containing protein n=1 Tax=Bacteroides sp. 51 TaxID=2302938 RepID=UPI0013D1794B|nr:glycoside hydrolase family 2 TIM barrel-domain containing protein [Bacteroides sp. 51]NDV84386.1 glycoside hydrolase family 2 protein [Bacteroides sp. 51]